MANIIDAIINLIENPIFEIKTHYIGKNRANNMGDALEEYIKDLFCMTFNENDENIRMIKQNEVFSYLGNNSNPPDIILRGGDAIEVKKIESPNSCLALNSSYPKSKLFSNSQMISNDCRDCEEWTEKDMIYIVGVIDKKKNTLKSLVFVYGIDYAASKDVYEKIKNAIKDGVETISNIEFSETKELGRVNKVDPLGITYLRVRGMWGIENPFKVFEYLFRRKNEKDFNFMAVINEEKWNTFDNTDKLKKVVENNIGAEIVDKKIRNPNNPAALKNVKLITYIK